MKILGATILINNPGCDYVLLKTDMPMATYPFKNNQNLKFEVAKSNALDYVYRNFIKANVFDKSSVTVIDIKTGDQFDINMNKK